MAVVAVSLTSARAADAGGIEIEGRAGSLTQNFERYRFGGKRVVDWASFATVDASVRYWVPYFYVGVTAGFGASVAESFESGALAPGSVDSFVRLYTGGLEIGTHLQAGAWTFRPGLALGGHHAVISTGAVACAPGGNPSRGVTPCDETAAAGTWFVQPGVSIDRLVSEHTYLGVRLGLDIPVAGPVVAFVIGFRTPGRSEPPPAP
jgi:hypothetical protein